MNVTWKRYMLQFFPPQAVDVDEGLDVMAERQTPAPEATPTDGGQEGHRVVRIVDLPAKKGDKNQESIVLMLMWESPEAGEDPILSLYSGGDGEWTVEESVAAWARLPITVLKTGHHASLPSTSRAFIEIAKPEHILLSAGKEHNHPGEARFRLRLMCRPTKAALSCSSGVGSVL